jgi:NAD(P) transhydrogenase subunit alpha
MYANNIANLLSDMTPNKDGNLELDLDDTVIRGSVVTHDGQTIWPPPQVAEPSPPVSVKHESSIDATGPPKQSRQNHWLLTAGVAIVAAFLIWFLGNHAPADFVSHFTVFVLACFVGWQLVWNVTPALHTPLMSVTNAISGIIVLGGMLQISEKWYSLPSLLALVAVLIATINVSGGFLVTHRMLAMFRKQD